MASATNSSSDYLLDIVRLHTNAIEILNALALTASTPVETVDIKMTLDNGTTSSISVPSLGYINSELKRLNTNIENMSGVGEKDVLVRQPDGSFKRIIAVNLSPAPRRISGLEVPANFVPKDNYFFNNLMSPLLTVRFNLTGKIDSGVSKVLVRRVVVDVDTPDKKALFENSFRGKNDIAFDQAIIYLTDSLLNFNIDDETVDLPVSAPRYYGSFSVIKILDTVQGVSNTRRYTFSDLSYTDSTSLVKSNQTLKPGDVLVKGSSLFSVTEVDEAKNIVTLKRTQGSDVVEIGTDVLAIQSELFNNQTINVPVALNEYQIIFVKPIQGNISSSEWSPGVGFYSNDLAYQTRSGSISISEFYNTNVIDLSEDLLSHARERKVSILTGSKPASPEILQENFVVKRLNDQLDGTQTEKELADIHAQVRNNDRKILSLTNELERLNQGLTATSTVSATSTPSIAYQASKDSIQKQIDSLNQLNSGLLTKAQNLMDQNPNLSTVPAKYSVFGFWQIPAARVAQNGKREEVVAFRVRYRYLPLNEGTISARELQFTATDGSTSSAYYSRWQEVTTKPRSRSVLPDGNVVWDQSDIQDPDQVNTQQIDIPITQGERIEIQVASLSEAGWPSNPLQSDFSPSIVVGFPESMVAPDLSNLVTNFQVRLSQKGIEDSITNLGVTEHIRNSTQVGATYVAHNAEEIAYSINSTTVITLSEKIRELEKQMEALKLKLEVAKGSIRVSVVDPYGNSIQVANGATINGNSGFYTEDIQLIPESQRKGAVVTKEYSIVIENTSASPLMLISQFPGVLADGLPSSPGTIFNGVQVPQDYSRKLYNKVPLGLASPPLRTRQNFYEEENVAMQPVPYQSKQQASQFLYSRAVSLNGLYQFYDQSTLATGLFPLVDNTFNSQTDASVWANDFDPVSTTLINGVEYLTPLAGGSLTAFCISVDHPAIKFVKATGNGQYGPSTSLRPNISNYFNSRDLNGDIDNMASTSQYRYPQFYHTSMFPMGPGDDPNKPKPQSGYFEFSKNSSWPYPMKMGFSNSDQYLIGSNTVGSYLYISAPTIESVKINGSGLSSFRNLDSVEGSKIVIPVIFQYRMTDRLNNLAGDPNPSFSNLSAIRGLGIDISISGEPLFSFDIILKASYVSDGSSKFTTQLTSTIQI